MLKESKVRKVSREISDAVDNAVKAFRDSRVQEEDKFTDRILGAIEDRITNLHVEGITWQARTLRTRPAKGGYDGEEKRIGADFMGVLTLNTRSINVKKGFLVQAKIVEPNQPFKGMKELRDQCEKMISITPDSFVALYSKAFGVRFVPANAIIGRKGNGDLYDTYSRGVRSFFELHLQCFIGDTKLNDPNVERLEFLNDQPIRVSLEISGEGY